MFKQKEVMTEQRSNSKKTFAEWFFGKFSLATPKEIAKLACPLVAMFAVMVANGAAADVYPAGETTT